MRCDINQKFQLNSLTHFNPRTYVRCDLFNKVSLISSSVFQSTHLREVRLAVTDFSTIPFTFQSTHLREVRRFCSSRFRTTLENFNPRTYVRCDFAPDPTLAVRQDFNPRTYVRCDGMLLAMQEIRSAFQSTHLREVRLQN